MQKLQKNISLQPYNTFNLGVKADYFFEFSQPGELITFLRGNSSELKDTDMLVLGGGSNILFTQDFRGVILHPLIKGVSVVEATDSYVDVRVGASEVWDDFVAYTVEQGWGGIENLSGIPGSAGAAPVQNLGAYGTEAKETIVKVEALRMEDYQPVIFTNKECGFAYRNSIFKNELRDKVVILNVILRLRKKPEFNLSYQGLEKELQQYERINLQNIRRAVLAIRSRKLPDPEEIGNGGSFFKNPVVSRKEAITLKRKFPGMVTYPVGANQVKVAAGWLIEKAGYKGIEKAGAGTHKEQALVLVNYGGADGETLKELALEIQQQVYNKFGLYLEPEVRIV